MSVVSCSRCGQEWARDPALEVACPKCGAAVGKPCRARRPSGHVHSASFAGLRGGVHPERDTLAMQRVPGYGRCPKARPAARSTPAALTLDLWTGGAS